MKKFVISLMVAVLAGVAWAATPIPVGDGITTVLPDVLPSGSYWTDGFACYHVSHSDGSVVRLEGGSLHEGGYVVNLERQGRSFKVLSSADDLEYTSFGELGSRVDHLMVDGQEVLVAYDTSDDPEPCEVLVRFDGDELAYELAWIDRVLAGDYVRDGKPFVIGDGKMGGKPYEVVKIYEMPSDIVKLSDGTCWALRQSCDKLLVFRPETADDPDDWYSMFDEAHFLFGLERNEGLSWFSTIITPRPALGMLSDRLLQMLDLLVGDDNAVSIINRGVIKAELKRRTDDGGQG